MAESRLSRWLLRAAALLVLGFLYLPLAVVAAYAFNASRGQSWPITEWTTKWFGVAWANPEVRSALGTSLQAAFAATGVALVLGTLAALAVHRFRFFGRQAVSFALVLPIALPGIVTGIALASAIDFGRSWLGIDYGLLTIIIGHATFCVVIVFNNVLARLRRTAPSLLEASQDLGADGWQTFRFVLLPSLGTALVAGGLLAFALSFDEIIVTNFTAGTVTTLPKWIFNNLRLPNQRPQVNVVALGLMLASLVPVYLAQRLTGAQSAGGSRI